ncbi:type II toxin-antitoxin system PemK/MazF family toxin [Streptomyces sp. RB6PN25]|uniref:Type II toxin-antitoxin system PemK/MazF family toxin n=1 Tax=Streptomyces humicola TaxID=2953240 RepID=A0ABT1PTV5_9ACTN|nr:type II toxin-antitoxin system PemK/MazF family toxin [Streptomyces humicola]MCQ4080558.1 type II toxin-antitoxin system PemK/MazF family toxin [Streptomyces humicola]
MAQFNGAKSRILSDQIYSVAPIRLGEFKGALDGDGLTELDRALMLKLGLI